MEIWMYLFLPLCESVMNIIYIVKSDFVDTKWCVEMHILWIYAFEWDIMYECVVEVMKLWL